MNKIWKAMGCGVGLRNKHYSYIMSEWPVMDWFEAVTENFMDTAGRPLAVLEKIRGHYPVALHGVALSIGSSDPLDRNYLRKLKALVKRVDPFVVSDHLCWTGVEGENLHDLLPLPLTEEALEHTVKRIGQVQDVLGRKILMENISTYVTYKHSVIPEWEFLREVSRRSGCGILLDLNNIYVNAANHRFDPERYLSEIPGSAVGQFHLAGHTDKGRFLFDTHSAAVVEGVWALYRRALERYGRVSTLIEWDEAIPDFKRLGAEVRKAKKIYDRIAKDLVPPDAPNARKPIAVRKKAGPSLKQTQIAMKRMIHRQRTGKPSMLNPQGGDSGEKRMAVYAEGYVARLTEALAEIYEAVKHLMGDEAFGALTESYLRAYPSHTYNLNFVGKEMSGFIRSTPYFKKLPFLPDLAKLEWTIAQAFHASSEKTFDPSSLKGFDGSRWEKARISFQPSVAVIRSSWPIVDLWKARKTPLKRLNVALKGRAQNAMIYRVGTDVKCEVLEEIPTRLLDSLRSGDSLGDACQQLAGVNESLPVNEWFSRWASQGLITRVG